MQCTHDHTGAIRVEYFYDPDLEINVRVEWCHGCGTELNRMQERD